MKRKTAQSGVTGKYFVATYTAPVNGAGTYLIPAPNPNPLRLSGLELVSGLPISIHPTWMDDINFARLVQAGAVKVEWVDRIPDVRLPEIDSAFDLDDRQKNFALELVRLWPNEQFKQAAAVAHHINPKTGLPKEQNSKVTVSFLKNKHLQTLTAARDLAGRWQDDRADLIGFLDEEVALINSL